MTTREDDPTYSTSANPETSEQKAPPPADSGASGERPGGAVKDPADILRGFTDTTSRVVQQAASILEEEIAAGILAAKQVEERMINVKETRSGKPDEVMQRFRRDAHEVVDILLDLVTAAAKSAGGIAQRVVSIRSGDQPRSPGSLGSGDAPTLAMPKAVRAGESVEAPMKLENDSETQTVHFSFRCSDLVNESGDRIAATQVTITPATLRLAPRQAEQVIVTVNVPADAPAGSYAGLLQATNLNNLRAVLVVHVN